MLVCTMTVEKGMVKALDDAVGSGAFDAVGPVLDVLSPRAGQPGIRAFSTRLTSRPRLRGGKSTERNLI